MKYLPFYIQAASTLGMFGVLTYGSVTRNLYDVLFGFCFGIVIGVALTLIRFQRKHVEKYGLYD